MNQTRARYLIGIDLGTTQCALAWLDLADAAAGIRVLPIPQLVSAHEVQARPTLPSVVFVPEPDRDVAPLPWGPSADGLIVGAWARDLGQTMPARYVHSAKSWLCHPRVDRTAPILPWQSELPVGKLSPVAASAAILRHLAAAWDYAMAATDAGNELRRQRLVVTVPASFDPVARSLTLQAIASAGFPEVMLLEEPQAAFYDHLYRHRDAPDGGLGGVRRALVVDIGGGTTDFSLIGVDPVPGGGVPTLRRMAVGPHLLIGGDNLDLAIAHTAEQALRVSRGQKLLTSQWLALIAQSRMVKERILGGGERDDAAFADTLAGTARAGGTAGVDPAGVVAPAPAGVGSETQSDTKELNKPRSRLAGGKAAAAGRAAVAPLPVEAATPAATAEFTILGAGSRVIARTVRWQVPEAALRQQLLDGFFPVVPATARPEEEGRLGLSEAGLPFSRDAAVTRHLAAFLADQKTMPDAVLFNGGTLASPCLQERLLGQFAAWRDGRPPKLLVNPRPMLAVAVGAVAYGMVLLGLGQRIESGNPSPWYLGIGRRGAARSGRHLPDHLVCVLPRGAPNERPVRLTDQVFGIDRSRRVAFYLYTCANPPAGEMPGDHVEYNPRRHRPLPPLGFGGDPVGGAAAPAPTDTTSDVPGARHDGAQAPARPRETPVSRGTTGPSGPAIDQVWLEAVWRVTGFLQLCCHDLGSGRVDELCFDVGARSGGGRRAGARGADPEAERARRLLRTVDPTAGESAAAGGAGRRARSALTRKHAAQVQKIFDELLAPGADRAGLTQVFKRLEEALEAPRKTWDLERLRALFDLVIDEPRFAAVPDGPITWSRLLGWCLRPGFGHPADPARLDRVWALHQTGWAETASVFWAEWWLLLKRIAPGLAADRQQTLSALITPLLFPSRKPDRAQRKVEAHERDQLWRLLGHLERLSLDEKGRLGTWITQLPASFSRDHLAVYALGRLGSRQLAYAEPIHLVPAATAGAWAGVLLRHATAGSTYLDFALREIGRRHPDRLVQIDDLLRKRIIDFLRGRNRKPAFLKPLLEVQVAAAEDFAESCGEDLPSGFVWVRRRDDPAPAPAPAAVEAAVGRPAEAITPSEGSG